jgi:GNAT superfamily N-acetyltransferase
MQAQSDIQADLTTQSGVRLRVRHALPADEVLVADFCAHVTPEDLSFRFLSGMKEVSHERLRAITRADDPRIINFLAFSPAEMLVAVGALAIDESLVRGEVVLSVRADHKHLGVSWTLLSHIAQYAERRGLKSIESLESRANRAAINLEREMGFEITQVADDPTLVLVKRELHPGP